MTDLWFSPGTLVSSTDKTDRHNIAEILLKEAFNTLTLISWALNIVGLMKVSLTTITLTPYSEGCLIQTYLGPTFVFGLYRLNEQRFPTLGFHFKFGFYRIPVYSELF